MSISRGRKRRKVAMSEGRLLVVDDELFVRELLQEYFTKLNYSVDIAKDGLDALALVRRKKYQAALIDLKMPNMDGVQLLKAIREIDQNVQLVMMTGYPTVESAVDALRKDAYDYVIKPFRLNELESIVSAAVADYQSERELSRMSEKVKRLEEALETARPWTPANLAAGNRPRFKLEEMPAPVGENWTTRNESNRIAATADLPVG